MLFTPKIICIAWLSVLAAACEKDAKPGAPTIVEEGFVKLVYDLSDLEQSTAFYDYQDRGELEDKARIPEASGLAVSRHNPRRIWVHNDKGNANRLFVLGENAESYGYFWIWGTGNRDWEDMCIGPGPEEGFDYIYLGDIGDNDAVYDQIIINRFKEPDISGLDTAGVNAVDAAQVERIILKYPDGPRDAETLMIDPWTKDLYIVTKREARSAVYVATYPQSTTEVKYLKKIAEFPFNRALAGDISADGTEIVVKTDRRIYYWAREQGESVLDALKREPLLLPYFVEPQGEAIGWTPSGSGYYTLSEKSGVIEPRLYYYQRK
jgi:dipeptidyl aminopeptidase/acylaminoacyl peptidase